MFGEEIDDLKKKVHDKNAQIKQKNKSSSCSTKKIGPTAASSKTTPKTSNHKTPSNPKPKS